MSIGQKIAVVIIGVCILCVSIFLLGNHIAKRYVSKRPHTLINRRVTKFGYVFYGSGILILLIGFSMQWFTPDTKFGMFVSSHLGRVAYAFGVVLIMSVIEKVLFIKGYKTTEKQLFKPSNN